MPLKNRNFDLKPLNISDISQNNYIDDFNNETSEAVKGDVEELTSEEIEYLFEKATGKENLDPFAKGGKSRKSKRSRKSRKSKKTRKSKKSRKKRKSHKLRRKYCK